jgi:hypothetical protein
MAEATAVDGTVWPPFCGAEYRIGLIVAPSVVCTLLQHDASIPHCNEELGWVWWGKE